MKFTEPSLAASLLDPEIEHTDASVFEAMKRLKYPVLATTKKDGIRGLRLNGTDLSRRFKPIPNKRISEASLIMPGGFDFEHYNPVLPYNTIQSIVMSKAHDDWDKIQFHILDRFLPQNPAAAYTDRIHHIKEFLRSVECEKLVFEEPLWCDTPEQLFKFEKSVVDEQGEGICLRVPWAPYKFGRSTLDEQFLVKVSRFVRREAFIIGFVEQLENCNPDAWAGTGKMDRSHVSAYMVGKATLGSFIVKDVLGLTFTIGTGVGLTKKMRQHIWNNRPAYLGKVFTYKCKAHGQKILPRSPVLVGWRKDGA